MLMVRTPSQLAIPFKASRVRAKRAAPSVWLLPCFTLASASLRRSSLRGGRVNVDCHLLCVNAKACIASVPFMSNAGSVQASEAAVASGSIQEGAPARSAAPQRHVIISLAEPSCLMLQASLNLPSWCFKQVSDVQLRAVFASPMTKTLNWCAFVQKVQAHVEQALQEVPVPDHLIIQDFNAKLLDQVSDEQTLLKLLARTARDNTKAVEQYLHYLVYNVKGSHVRLLALATAVQPPLVKAIPEAWPGCRARAATHELSRLFWASWLQALLRQLWQGLAGSCGLVRVCSSRGDGDGCSRQSRKTRSSLFTNAFDRPGLIRKDLGRRGIAGEWRSLNWLY